MRIGLLGDIHFGKDSRTMEFAVPGVPPTDHTEGGHSLKDGVAELLREKSVDFIFVTGDLTSTGSPLEFSLCHKKISEIAEASNVEASNVLICAGNHDIDWNVTKLGDQPEQDSEEFPRNENIKAYQRVASNICDMFFSKDVPFTETGPAPLSGVLKLDNIEVYVLNSGWMCSHKKEHKHGRLGEKQLEWFEEASATHSEKWKIVLLHHHPFNYPYPDIWHDTSTLEEGSELVDIAAKNGIQLICHGHRHHPKAINDRRAGWNHAITFICAGSLSVNAGHRGDVPNVCHIITLDEHADHGKYILLETYQFSQGEGWHPVGAECKEVPMDPMMLFHRPHEEDALETLLKSSALTNDDTISFPEWKDLPIPLRTKTYSSINQLIHNVYESDYDIIGEIPKKVVGLRKNQ